MTLCAAIWAPTFLAELAELSGIVATLVRGYRCQALGDAEPPILVDGRCEARGQRRAVDIGSLGGHDHIFVPRIERAGPCGNHDLHAIDATPARRRGGVDSSPLD